MHQKRPPRDTPPLPIPDPLAELPENERRDIRDQRESLRNTMRLRPSDENLDFRYNQEPATESFRAGFEQHSPTSDATDASGCTLWPSTKEELRSDSAADQHQPDKSEDGTQDRIIAQVQERPNPIRIIAPPATPPPSYSIPTYRDRIRAFTSDVPLFFDDSAPTDDDDDDGQWTDRVPQQTVLGIAKEYVYSAGRMLFLIWPWDRAYGHGRAAQVGRVIQREARSR